MDVRNCRQCGRLYNYIGGGSYRNICPDCIAKMEEKFQEVKLYIQENAHAGINDISADCGVSGKQIEQWIREERLFFADDSPIGIACESCGKTIKSGRYCKECKDIVLNQLGSMYNTNIHAPKNDGKSKQKARMRFLDK